MKIKEDTGFCTCCGTYQDLEYGEENHSFLKKDLTNFNNYKKIFVFRCPNCNFVNVNITDELGILYHDIVKDKDYIDDLNYSCLEGLDKQLWEMHSENINANEYEAYALMCIKDENIQNAIRALYESNRLYEMMARKYRYSQDELGGEEDNDAEYERLDDLINYRIDKNYDKILELLKSKHKKNIFEELIRIELLNKLGAKNEAKSQFEDICKKHSLAQDLREYFANLLK